MSRQLTDDWITSWLKYQDNSEAPRMFKKWVAISMISSVMQRKLKLQWGTIPIYPNMYIILTGPPASRKGTAMNPGLKVLRKMNINLAAESITREMLIRELKESRQEYLDHNTGKTLGHCSLTVYSPELVVFIGHQNLALMSDLCDWFDCPEDWKYRTKTQGDDVMTNLWFSMIGGTTPALLQSAMPSDAVGSGFGSRVIFVYEEKKGKTIIYPGLAPEALVLEPKVVHDLEQISMLNGEFKITEGFMELYSEWYPAQDNYFLSEDPRLANYCDRRPLHLLKLSMIHSVARSDSLVIERCDLEEAINTLHEVEKKMPFTFSGVGKSDIAAVMAPIMALIAQRKRITSNEILRNFYHDIDFMALERIIKVLVHMRYVREVFSEDGAYLEYID